LLLENVNFFEKTRKNGTFLLKNALFFKKYELAKCKQLFSFFRDVGVRRKLS